jgi:hypothetical protein
MFIRRTVFGSAALALALLGTAPAASAATTTAPAPAAAGWLATQLTDGNHFQVVIGKQVFLDQGLTADAVLAFDAAKVAQDAATRATTWLAIPDVLAGYIGDGVTVSRAGQLGKAALVAEAQGLDPAAFGGRDLLGELRALQAASGRFSDKFSTEPGDGDFSSSFSQSLAVLALHRAGGAGVPAAAVDFLAGSQCPDGGFPQSFGEDTCSSSTEATGIVVQALLAAGRTGPVGSALNWLASVQRPDGGFAVDGAPKAEENANFTALAGQGLRAGGRTAAADRAVGYLLARQVGCAGQAADRGAVASSATGFDPGTAPRATAQAVTALAGVGLADISATGAAGPAPRLACATPTPTATPTTPHPTTPHTTVPAAPGAGGGGTLPATGTPTGALTGIAVLLLAAGGGLLVLGRQRRSLRRAAGR